MVVGVLLQELKATKYIETRILYSRKLYSTKYIETRILYSRKGIKRNKIHVFTTIFNTLKDTLVNVKFTWDHSMNGVTETKLGIIKL